LGVDGVGLATTAVGGLVGLVDLDDGDAGGQQVPGERRAVGAGAFTPARRSVPKLRAQASSCW